MNEKKSDKLDERLKAELLREEERMTKLIESDESLKKYHVTEEMDRRMEVRIQRAKAERAAYQMLSEADKEAIRISREREALRGSEAEDAPILITRRKKKRKVYLLVAIAAVMMFAFGMTSIGGVPFVLEFMEDKLGNREMTKVDSGREGEDKIIEDVNQEAKFYQEVSETLGIEFVRLGYMPKKADFIVGEIDEELKRVTLLYDYDEKIIEYRFVLNYNPKTHGHDVEDYLIDEKIIEVSSVPIKKKVYNLPDDTIQYGAEFEYKGTFYTINAAILESEFEQILQSLIFF